MSVGLYLLCVTLVMGATIMLGYHFIVKPRLYKLTDDNLDTEQTTVKTDEQIVNLDISNTPPTLNIPIEFGFNDVTQVRIRTSNSGTLEITPTQRLK